jgi:ElaB/YqjD/DUF883 family membrane-anchored ribosome-binding protein
MNMNTTTDKESDMGETTSTTEGVNSSPKRGAQASERLASAAHDTIDRVADTAARAERDVRDGAAKIANKVRESEDHAMEATDATLKAARAYVRENPIISAGIAFAAGIALSGLLRR